MTRSTRPHALAAPLVALVLLLGACGSDDEGAAPDASSATADAGGPSGAPEVSAELQKCLGEQGVEPPSEAPTDSTTPGLTPELQEAFQACADLAPSGGPGGTGIVDQSALDAFADCMSSNGVEVDATLEAVTALDQSDADVVAALETCAPLIQP